jgi:putative ABC transport system permease protein
MNARTRAIFSLAWRESRTARRRLALYMSSISLGVAALVAIDSFALNVTDSVRDQSRALVGGDLVLSSNDPFTPRADSLLDSLARQGIVVARMTEFGSMARLPRTTGTRLSQVKAVTDAYPLYGKVITEPAGRWEMLQRGAYALVDETLLIALDGRVGDTLALGYGTFEIAGILREVPGTPALASAIAPRVFIPARYLPETQLLVFGSRADHEALLRVPESMNAPGVIAKHRGWLESSGIRVRSVNERERRLTDSIDTLSDFLGIVGLIALLLGGIGVASGVHAFVARKIDTVAVLRCLGGTGMQVTTIYAMQAAAMGLVGAAIGAALGVAIQFALPLAISDMLPVNVTVTLEWQAITLGLLIGVWVAVSFALRPLLGLRGVSPLQALRRDADTSVLRRRWRDPGVLVVDIVLVSGVVLMALTRSETTQQAAGIVAGIAVVLAVLYFAAVGLSRVSRRVVGARWPYVVRQGVANLYRPANQTRAVVLSLGFGAFLISTLYLVQSNLLRQFDATAQASSGNLLLFDVQEDQEPGVDSIVRASGETVLQSMPMIQMRIHEINGRPVRDYAREKRIRADHWAFRREYRSTYRDSLVSSEKLVAGRWFRDDPVVVRGDTLAGEVSLEEDLANTLMVRIGDVITWDVQGLRVPVRISSLRTVDWERFEPNFFAVFSPDAVRAAPKQFIITARVADDRRMGLVQRDVVDRYPNVSSIDLSLIRRTILEIVDRVSLAVRFLAIFSLAMGIPVLFSAVAATRRERIREGVLLKTLGATRSQIGRIMLSEYALLGLLGSISGMLLSFGGAWALTKWVFQMSFAASVMMPVAIAAMMLMLTVVIGWMGGRDVFRETAMATLRTE